MVARAKLLAAIRTEELETILAPDYATLIWPAHRVIFRIVPCILGCPRHKGQGRGESGLVIPKAKARYVEEIERLKSVGWEYVSGYECDVEDEPERFANMITVAVAIQITSQRWRAHDDDPESALIVMDAARKTTVSRFRSLVYLISQLGALAGYFRKQDVQAGIFRQEMSDKEFDDVWKLCLYHGVLEYNQNGFRKGRKFDGLFNSMGLQTVEKEKVG